MEKDKNTVAIFLGALVLILIMLITTIVNISNISKNLDRIKENDSANDNTSYTSSVNDEENIVLKSKNTSDSEEDDDE